MAETATFTIKIDAQSNAPAAGDSVEALRQKLLASQEAVKSYGSALRGLRGSSDEVKSAKTQLKAAVDAERASISQANLALLKQGTTYESVAKSAREKAKADKDAASSAGKLSGPLGEANSKLEDFREKLGSSSGRASLLAAGFVGLAAAAVGLATSLAGAAFSLAKFVVEEASALRTMSLFREAATGSAENAKAFGHQIDALGDKIPTPRAELNELSLSLSRALVGTRVSGQGIVDTFNAVAQTSAAMGDSAGKAIEGIITRGKMMGRLGLGINELQGTGLNFQDVAGQLSKNLKIGIAEAQNQLRMGRVKIDDGAKAIRDAVEKRFGKINASRMLDINVQLQKFKDNLANLTKNVDIEKILKPFAELGKLFSEDSVLGYNLQKLVTAFGNGLGDTFRELLPAIKKLFYTIVNESLKAYIAVYDLDQQFKNILGTGYKMKFLEVLFGGILLQWKALLGIIELATDALAAFTGVGSKTHVNAAKQKVADITGKPIADDAKASHASGKAITDGLKAGVDAGAADVANATKSLGKGAKDSFRDTMGIHSPSAVFAEYGAQTAAGYKQGIDANAESAQTAVNGLAPKAPEVNIPALSGAPAASGNTTVSVTLNLEFPNAKNGSEVSQALQGDANLKANITKLFEQVLRGQGVPTS